MIINTPDDWTPTAANINALPKPVREYIMRLHANTDPAGELRRAMIAEMERDALRKMIEEAPEGTIESRWVSGTEFDAFYFRVLSQADLDKFPQGKRVKLLEVE